MGFRSSIVTFGKRLLAALLSSRTNHHTYTHTRVHTCRVCIVEQAIASGDNSVCASHRMSQLTSRPLPPLPTLRALPALPDLPPTPVSASYTQYQGSFEHPRYSRMIFDDAQDRQFQGRSHRLTSTQIRAQDDIRRHNRPFARLVISLQDALCNVRYAISGHMAIRLFSIGSSNDDWCKPALGSLDDSHQHCLATQPSIVCPLATRDVLPSWAAASQNAFQFDHRRPDELHIRVDGQRVAVCIDWVEDHEFDCGTYTVDRVEDACHVDGGGDPYERLGLLDIAPPVLSLPCLLQHAAYAYAYGPNCQHEQSQERCSMLGRQVDACLRILAGETATTSCSLWRFSTQHELLPALCDPDFYNPYCAEFGVDGAHRLQVVCGGMPPDDTAHAHMPSTKYSIPRKPLPAGSRYKSLPTLPAQAAEL